MSKYRTHTCGELNKTQKDKEITLSGWVNKKRDHGNLLFLDLRDNYGITQCVTDKENKNFKQLEKIQLETVVQIQGKVIERSKETIILLTFKSVAEREGFEPSKGYKPLLVFKTSAFNRSATSPDT